MKRSKPAKMVPKEVIAKATSYQFYHRYHLLQQPGRSGKTPNAASVMFHECPECGAEPGHYCRDEKRLRVWPPHKARVQEYMEDFKQ